MSRMVAVAVAVAATAAAGCVADRVSEATAGSTSGHACRSNPLQNVHNPDRLKLVNPCVTVTGIVRVVVLNRHDHDANFDLQVDPPYDSLIGAGNRERLGGLLHVEVVPADQPGCRPGAALLRVNGMDVGICTGAAVVTPRVGDRVAVTGAYVVDATNAWREIHPAWLVVRQ